MAGYRVDFTFTLPSYNIAFVQNIVVRRNKLCLYAIFGCVEQLLRHLLATWRKMSFMASALDSFGDSCQKMASLSMCMSVGHIDK
jgi:hypothetical protein